MRFEPKTEQEVASAGLFARGTYDFEVADATEKQSKAGNDMVELLVQVYDKDGKSRKLFDWLVSTDGAAYKIRHFAEATGMLSQYEKGELRASDMIGKTGRCEIIIKKDKTGEYPDKNAISDYVGPATPGSAAARNEMEDDSIPF